MFKQSIIELSAYHPQKELCEIILDANESYVNAPYNRYPDSIALDLRREIAQQNKLSVESIMVGNGSSELIDLVMKCTLSPGDQLLTFGPTFSIYELNAAILGAETVTMMLGDTFDFDAKAFVAQMEAVAPKLIILCNPNNPTGTLLTKAQIMAIVEATEAVVVVDEAYIEFGGESVMDLTSTCKNLIVLRTLSKAYGLAGVRVGYMVTSADNIEIIDKVRPPYNVSAVAQKIALETLQDGLKFEKVIDEILEEKEMMMGVMKSWVQIYPGGGNFIFFKTDKADLYEALVLKGIRIRKYSGGLDGYYRVTIGSKLDNSRLIEAMEAIYEI